MTSMDLKQAQAMARVVRYMSDEQAHYEEDTDENKPVHVWNDVQVLARIVKAYCDQVRGIAPYDALERNDYITDDEVQTLRDMIADAI